MTTVMEHQDFMAFMENHMQLAIAGKFEIEKIDEWTYKLTSPAEKDAHMQIYFGNVYENYKRTSDINIAIDFLKTQVTILDSYGDLSKEKSVDLDSVFPVFREAGYASSNTEANKGLIRDDFSDALSVLYVQDHPQFVTFFMESALPDGMTTEDLTDRAFQNLLKQGWVEPSEIQECGEYATLYVFQNPTLNYQAQFMVREMFEPHLGDYFFFSMPVRDVVCVLKWKDDPMKFKEISAQLSIRLKLMTVGMYSEMQGPLSPVVHVMSKEGVRILG